MLDAFIILCMQPAFVFSITVGQASLMSKAEAGSKLKKSLHILQKQAFNVSFNLTGSPYDVLETIGTGAYGVVCSAVNRGTGGKVAIKKIPNALHNPTVAKRSLREVRILRQFNHPNIISIVDMLHQTGAIGTDIYIVFDLMERDLHHIIHSKQPLTPKHLQYFLYQILCGMKYIHSGNIIHRDLKPSNIMVNADCSLKIGDFGMARVAVVKEGQQKLASAQAQFMTQYVATRWYRAPELLFSMLDYFSAVDLWSTGCIFAELLLRRQLFAAKDNLSQLKMIIYYLGSPPPEMMAQIQSEIVQRIIKGVGHKCPLPWNTMFPKLSEEGLDLVGRMLTLSPWERITAETALEHPYLEEFHDAETETTCPHALDLASLEVEHLSKQEIIETLLAEIRSFRPDVRTDDFVDEIARRSLHHNVPDRARNGNGSSLTSAVAVAPVTNDDEVQMLSAQIQEDLALHEEDMQVDDPVRKSSTDKEHRNDCAEGNRSVVEDHSKQKLRNALLQAMEARKTTGAANGPIIPKMSAQQARHLEKLKKKQRRGHKSSEQPKLDENPEFNSVSDKCLLERWSKLSNDSNTTNRPPVNLEVTNRPAFFLPSGDPPPGFQNVKIDARNPALIHAEHLIYRNPVPNSTSQQSTHPEMKPAQNNNPPKSRYGRGYRSESDPVMGLARSSTAPEPRIFDGNFSYLDVSGILGVSHDSNLENSEMNDHVQHIPVSDADQYVPNNQVPIACYDRFNQENPAVLNDPTVLAPPQNLSFLPNSQSSYAPDQSSYAPDNQLSYVPDQPSYVPDQSSYVPDQPNYVPAPAGPGIPAGFMPATLLALPTCTTSTQPVTTSPTTATNMEDDLQQAVSAASSGGLGMAQLGEIISQSLPSPLSGMSNENSARLLEDWRTLTQQLSPTQMEAVEREMWG